MDISVNNLPPKIKDGCLLDAMVNLRFITEFNHKAIENAIEAKLDSLDANIKKFAKVPVIINGEMQHNRIFFANDQYRIMVEGESISFNIVDQYPTWQPYKAFVEEVIEALKGILVIVNLNVRYLSHFGNIPLFENIDGDIKLKHLQAFTGAQYSFQCNASDGTLGREPAKATVVLTDRREIAPGQLESMIDIKVENNIVRGVAIGDVMRCLDFVHVCEKHLFFTIISDKFFNQLK